ncbi:endothelin-converting enzyme 2 isoform X2 [Stomoxys calcitrans]|uniref:endothelin-converting enzyme 2 isoform X2 n=1 Tax=Stomoxys calcitrans TaxID=35570 RepID=UPI0027E224B1|nr:endothelin-converting enzyme 2 isoform X2 [Stomoxys calcitrans]
MFLGVMTATNPSGSSHSTLLQKQMSFKTSVGANQLFKNDDVDMIESGHTDAASMSMRYKSLQLEVWRSLLFCKKKLTQKFVQNLHLQIFTGSRSRTLFASRRERERKQILTVKPSGISWICCAPCTWLRSSAAIHKISITTATLLVTLLLVASPILFLISTAPSQLPRDCYQDDDMCSVTATLPTECMESICREAAQTIHANLDWKVKPCEDFKNFSCPTYLHRLGSFNVLHSAQETVDLQMQHLLQHNTTTGPFRKLGRLFGSCLRQSLNSSSLRLVSAQLGGYLPIGAVGPSSISELIAKIFELGPTPLIDIYFDLSYGRRPHAILIVNVPSTPAPILETKVRWMGPKAPPHRLKFEAPTLLRDFLETFLPKDLTAEQTASEMESISAFIKELNKIRIGHYRRGFWDSVVLYNISSMVEMYPALNWTSLIPGNWSGPIVVRSSEYLKAMEGLMTKYSMRVAHNSILVLFALGVLPQDRPSPSTCTKATMWALPDISSALLMAQYSPADITEAVQRIDVMFKSLKSHLKRAPSLKGAALVKLSALKIQAVPWSGFSNASIISKSLEIMDITSDNWFANVLNIYKRTSVAPEEIKLNAESHEAWAYPTVARIFYDTLSHSIVVPISIILRPYFDSRLPPYMQYASIGVAVAKEILRSVTKSFEDKAMRCVPKSVNIFSNYSRMDILIHSGGMQISYHSMLSLTGPTKGMARLPGLNLTPTQIFFLVSAQELCAESHYSGIDVQSLEFEHILGWLVAQGGSAAEVYECPVGSMINSQKTCNVL